MKLKVVETISCASSDYSKEEAIKKQILLLLTYCKQIGKYEVYEVNKT